MAKRKISVSVDPRVLAGTDAAARQAGLSRSQYVEAVLRDAYYRRRLTAGGSVALALSETEQAQLRALLHWQQHPDPTAKETHP